jgi:integrase
MAHVQKVTYTGKATDTGPGKTTVAWRARYRDQRGKEYTARFRRKVDAENWLKMKCGDVVNGVHLDPALARLTLADWVPEWKATLVKLRPSTKHRDLDYVERYILPTFGQLALGEIDFMSVQAWLAMLTETGPLPWWDTAKEPKRKRRPVAATTAIKAKQILGKIMGTAVKAGKIKANPCTDVELPEIVRKDMRIITPTQIDALAEAILPRYKALVLVKAYGGLRIGELAGLRRSRVDVAKGRVRVEEIGVEVAGHLHYGAPKTGAGRRSIKLPAYVLGALVDHMDTYTGPEPDAFVFTSPEGSPLRVPQWRQRCWTPAIAKAGLVPLRPHDLRHTAVSLWIDSGANVLEVSKRAGHTSVSFTLDRYGHLFEGADEGIADRLDALIAANHAAPPDDPGTATEPSSGGHPAAIGESDDAMIIPFLRPDQATNRWALEDSNLRPQPCEGCALTN